MYAKIDGKDGGEVGYLTYHPPEGGEEVLPVFLDDQLRFYALLSKDGEELRVTRESIADLREALTAEEGRQLKTLKWERWILIRTGLGPSGMGLYVTALLLWIGKCTGPAIYVRYGQDICHVVYDKERGHRRFIISAKEVLYGYLANDRGEEGDLPDTVSPPEVTETNSYLQYDSMAAFQREVDEDAWGTIVPFREDVWDAVGLLAGVILHRANQNFQRVQGISKQEDLGGLVQYLKTVATHLDGLGSLPGAWNP